jgi:hypothetical protein
MMLVLSIKANKLVWNENWNVFPFLSVFLGTRSVRLRNSNDFSLSEIGFATVEGFAYTFYSGHTRIAVAPISALSWVADSSPRGIWFQSSFISLSRKFSAIIWLDSLLRQQSSASGSKYSQGFS